MESKIIKYTESVDKKRNTNGRFIEQYTYFSLAALSSITYLCKIFFSYHVLLCTQLLWCFTQQFLFGQGAGFLFLGEFSGVLGLEVEGNM